MKKKNGFIATSLIYSFFLVFITLFLGIVADYLQQKVLLNTIETDIKKDINSTLGIRDFEIDDIIYFDLETDLMSCGMVNYRSLCNISNDKAYKITAINYDDNSSNYVSNINNDFITICEIDEEYNISSICETIYLKYNSSGKKERRLEIEKHDGVDGITIVGVKE